MVKGITQNGRVSKKWKKRLLNSITTILSNIHKKTVKVLSMKTSL